MAKSRGLALTVAVAVAVTVAAEVCTGRVAFDLDAVLASRFAVLRTT